MNITQQISNHPFIPSIQREVRLLNYFPNMGMTNIKSGNLSISSSKIDAQYEILEYTLVSGTPMYSDIKYIEYTCSESAKIRVTDLANGLLDFVTDNSAPDWDSLPTEKDFILTLLFLLNIGKTHEEIHQMFIYNLDTRITGSVFNQPY
jgi:hypothetical protein